MIGRAAPDVSRSVTAALPVALLLPLVAIIAGTSRALVESYRYSMMAAFTVLGAGLACGFYALTNKRLPRAGAVASAHLLAWVPVFFVSALSALDTSIVYLGDGHMGCGTGAMSLFVFGLPVAGLALLLGGIGVSIAFTRRGANGVLRAGAIGAVALSLLGLALASARLGKPEPDRYLASLHEVATMHEGQPVVVAGRVIALRHVPAPKVPAKVDPTGGATTGGSEDDNTNHNPIPARTGECRFENLDADPFSYIEKAEGCPEVRFDVDPSGDTLVTHSRYAHSSWMAHSAYRLPSWERIGITPRSYAPRFSMPFGWWVGAAFGSLSGVVMLAYAARARRRRRTFTGTEGTHRGQGWVELAHDRAVKVPAAEALPIGPVVLFDIHERAPTYREAGTPTFTSASAGTLADAKATMEDREASLHGLALAIASLGFAPLLAARIVGLL